MTNRRTFLGAVSGLSLLAVSATGAFAQEVTLNLHQFLPAQANVPRLILDVWADNVERDSDGRIPASYTLLRAHDTVLDLA